MIAADLRGDARTGSISLLRARRRREGLSGFPDPVSMTVCPCTVLGFPRVSGVARLRSRFRSGS